ncbi:MAG: tRNA (adenosine(37)-N6)-threonylcarbamoyltransferase complex dimerization subunit type 1 TsaB [Dehalococcoidales bacterium]|nr:MAG: tRNA (adenosine(37)-N6)-threonylcarbamoyltransferase complex dimerization subunit type 1 TsaB [Dehalococcoidales bacterium]
MQLAIDTSTDTASLALVKGKHVVAELTWRCGQNHTRQLLPNLDHLLRQFELGSEAITGIIIARGPGSFNGLRVGVSTAKGLAFSLGVPIVGINSLETEAYQHAETGLPVCPIFNAGRGEISAGMYQRRDDEWLQLVDEHITTVEALCLQITTRTVFCGEYLPAIAPQIKELCQGKAVIPSVVTSLRRAGFLAELGLRRLEAGDHDDPATLQPLYLRRPSITKAKHR